MFVYWAILLLLQTAPYDPVIDTEITGEPYDAYLYDPAIDSIAGVDREVQMYDPEWVDPIVIAEVAPEYPQTYYNNPVEVTVYVDVYVDTYGSVTSANIVSSGGQDFDEAALEAVYGWVFEPGTLHYEPTRSVITLPIRFTPDMIPGWEEDEKTDSGTFFEALFPDDE